MSDAVLRAFIEAMPRLQAQEALGLFNAVALGSGNLKKHEANRILREWRRTAGQGSGVQKPKTREEHQARLAMMGISFG